MNNTLLIKKNKVNLKKGKVPPSDNNTISGKAIIKIPRDLKSKHKYFINSLFCEMFDKI